MSLAGFDFFGGVKGSPFPKKVTSLLYYYGIKINGTGISLKQFCLFQNNNSNKKSMYFHAYTVPNPAWYNIRYDVAAKFLSTCGGKASQ